MAANKKVVSKTLQERHVEALERIASVLEFIDENFIEKMGLPVSICTSNGLGETFPIDVVVHKSAPRKQRSRNS